MLSKFPTRITLKVLALFCLLVFIPVTVSADGAYSWKDKSGKTNFGSNPPKGATEIKKLSGDKFSRYSGSKSLAPYERTRANLAEIEVKDADIGEKELSKDDSFTVQTTTADPAKEPTVVEPEKKLEGEEDELVANENPEKLTTTSSR